MAKIKQKWALITACILAGMLFVAALFVVLYKDNSALKTQKLTDIEWYSETQKEFTITTAQEFYDLIVLSQHYNFKGQTVKLGADIVLNEGNAVDWKETAPKNKWTPIKQFAGTFDGQGHSISGVYLKKNSVIAGLFGTIEEGALIQDFKLVNSYIETNGRLGTGSVAGLSRDATLRRIYCDTILHLHGRYNGGLIGRVGGKTIVEECWFDGEMTARNYYSAGMVAQVGKGTLTMSNCLNTAKLIGLRKATQGLAGYVVAVGSNAKLILKDCLNAITIESKNIKEVASLLTLCAANARLEMENVISLDTGYSAICAVGNGAYTKGGVYQMAKEELLGTKAYEWTELDFDKYWVAVENDTPRLKYFSEEGMNLEGVTKAYDISWYDENAKEYLIDTKEKYYGFYIMSQLTDFAGKSVKLGSDLSFNSGKAADWEEKSPDIITHPISHECYPFAGTFDGQGHTLSGLYAKGYFYIGMFAETSGDATVQNLNLHNSYFESLEETDRGSFIGSIAGYGGGTFDTIYSNAIVVGRDAGIGGIFGQVRLEDYAESFFMNCWYDGTIKLYNGWLAGGIVGDMRKGDVSISHCLNTGEIISQGTRTSVRCGGIMGNHMAKEKLLIEDCLNTGKVTANKYEFASSVLGYTYSGGKVEIKDTFTTPDSYIHPIWGVPIGVYDKGNVVKGGALHIDRENLIGKGGYEWTTLDFDKYWTIVSGGTPILQTWADKIPSVAGLQKAYDTSWYKEDEKTFVIKNKKQLIGFYLLAKVTNYSDKTIKLGADITLNSGDANEWGEHAPKIKWAPVGDPSMYGNFAGTFDGQGHTLSGIYAKREMRVGLFGQMNAKAVVKNLKITNSYFESTEDGTGKGSFVGSITGYAAGGKLEKIKSEAIVVGHDVAIGGLVGQSRLDKQVGNGTIINNCWFAGTVNVLGKKSMLAGGILGDKRTGEVTITNCLNTGHIVSESAQATQRTGGLVGGIQSKGFVMKDCLNTGKITTKKYDGVGSVIGMVAKGTGGEIRNTYTTKESHVYKSLGVPMSIMDNSNSAKGGAYILPEAKLIGKGGYEWTELDFNEYWTTVENGTPILKSFAGNIQGVTSGPKAFDISWYKEKEKTYSIKTKEQLYGLSMLSKIEDFEGKTIKLHSDITMNQGQNASDFSDVTPSESWTPIGDRYFQFKGTFDGQGHTISGLYAKEIRYAGLFGYTTEQVAIKDLILTNSYFESTATDRYGSFSGSVTGFAAGGIFENLKSDAIVVGNDIGIGGLIGQSRLDKQLSQGTIINNCWFAGTIKAGKNAMFAAGILGDKRSGETVITNCLNTGSIVSESEEATQRTGGLVGGIQSKGFVMEDCLNTGKITTKKYDGVGSVIGMVAKGTGGEIRNTYTTAESHVYKSLGVPMSIMDNFNSAKGGAYILPEAKLIGKGGYEWTELDFNKYWTTVENGTPILKSFAGNIQGVTSGPKAFDISWYKEKEKTYSIKTKEQLHGLSMLSKIEDFEGKTIKLHSDITMNQGQNASDFAAVTPSESWTPIGDRYFQFKGTFDGQGHKISGLYAKELRYAGLFGYITEQVTIKDLILANSYFESTATDADGSFAGSVAGFAAGGTLKQIKSNSIVVGHSAAIGGLVGQSRLDKQADKGTVIHNCWFAGTAKTKGNGYMLGGILGDMRTGDVTIEHCLVTGSIEHAGNNTEPRIGGILGNIISNKKYTLTIKDSLNAAEMKPGKAGAYFASVLGYTGNIKKAVMEDVFASAESYGITVVDDNGFVQGTAYSVAKNSLIGDGGFEWTSLDFKDYWTTVKTGTPILQDFAKKIESVAGLKKKYGIEWIDEAKGTEDDPYRISTVADLYGLARLAETNTFAGKYFLLTEDLVLNQGNAQDWKTDAPKNLWTPIGSYDNGKGTRFAGKFNGDGHTISGLYCEVPAVKNKGVGLFGATGQDSEIKNLRLTNSYFKQSTGANAMLGSFVGYATGAFEQLYSDAIIDSKSSFTGGIIGGTYNQSVFHECWYDGKLTVSGDAYTGIGGIVGRTNGSTEMLRCLNTGSITSSSKAHYMGGLVGAVANAITIKDSLNAAAVSSNASNNVGTIIGVCMATGSLDLTRVYAPSTSGSKTIGYDNTNTFATNYGMVSADITGYNGSKNLNLEAFEQYWVATGTSPVLKSLATSGILYTPDTEFDIDADGYYLISTPEELYGFAKLVNESAETMQSGTSTLKISTLKARLTKDIIVNDGTVADWEGQSPMYSWIPIGGYVGGSKVRYQGHFDGQGYSISGIYCKVTAVKDQGIGLFGAVWGDGRVENLKLTNSYFEAYNSTMINMYLGSIAGYNRGCIDKVYSDAIVKGTGSLVAGIAGRSEGSISESWFAGSVEAGGTSIGGIVGYTSGVTITNCLNTGTVTGTHADGYVGGIVGRVFSGTNQISNSLNAGQLSSKKTATTGTVIGHENGKVTLTNVYAVKDETYTKLIGTGAQETGSVSGTKERADITGYGAIINLNLFNTEQVWVARTNDVPSLARFTPKDECICQDNYYLIGSPDDLYAFAAAINAGNIAADSNAKLTANITVNPGSPDGGTPEDTSDDWSNDTVAQELRKWTPIGGQDGGSKIKYAGHFDGQGYNISGIYCKISAVKNHGIGLFGAVVSGGRVENLKLTNSYFRAYNQASNIYLGSIAGYNRGSIDKVYSDAIVKGTGSMVAGIAGRSEGSISESWFAGSVEGGGTGIGGIVGYTSGVTITNCLNTGSVTGTHTSGYVGGFVGQVASGTVQISNSLNAGQLSSKNANTTGTVIGSEAGTVTLTNVYAEEDATYTKLIGKGTQETGSVSGTKERANITGYGALHHLGELNVDNLWVERSDDVPSLKRFIKKEEEQP